MRIFFFTLLLFGIVRAHPIDEGRQVAHLRLTPEVDRLRLTMQVEFDPSVSELILSAYDLDGDGAFSDEEQSNYALGNMELALDLVEVSAGLLSDYYTHHRRLDPDLLQASDQDRNGLLNDVEYFGIVREQAPEQYYLFDDRSGSKDFRLTATNTVFRASVLQGDRKRSVQFELDTDYFWPERVPMKQPFGCKINLAYRSVNVSSGFSLGEGLSGVRILDQLHLNDGVAAVDWEILTADAFRTLPKTRRTFLLLERGDEAGQNLP